MTKIINTEVIEIEYENKDLQEVEKIRNAISKNYLFFQDLVRPYTRISFTNRPNTIQVSSYEDFKQYIGSRLPEFLKQLKESLASNKELNDVVYLKFILLDKYQVLQNYSPVFAGRDDLYAYINSIYTLTAADYYENPDDLLNFMFELKEEDKEKILNDLLEKRRFDLLNHLLQEQLDLMIQGTTDDTEYDSFLRNHMSEILSISQIDFMNGNIVVPNEETKVELPKINRTELHQLVREILMTIDPSLKWLKIYNEALDQNRIVYGKLHPDDKVEWCCTPHNGVRCIAAPLTGTIKDFRCMIHELMHYISLMDTPIEEINAPTLDEYPSIVFETLAIKFLKTKGYSDEVLHELLKERTLWTQDNIFDITPTLKMLNEFVTEGPISFEGEQEKNKHLQAFIDDNLSGDMKEQVERLVSTADQSIIDRCDFEIMFILSAPLAILDEYPYVLGRYLSTKTLEKLEEDPMLIYKLFEITENLQFETPQSVIRKMNLSDEIFSSPKEYQKKN